MDPWLEDPGLYADLRFTFVVRLSNALNAVLPDGYASRIRHITDEVGSTEGESFVEGIAIRDTDEDDVPLIAIELPERHRRWRACRVRGHWTFARILIRLFRDPWADASGLPFEPQILTQRLGEVERVEVEAIDYRKLLPILRVPWLPGESDLEIPLQPLLDYTYDTGRYPMRVNYNDPCDPPLTAEQQEWAEGVLRAKGLLK
jgi:hypothetical protein